MKILLIILLSSYLFAGPPMKSNDPFVPALHEFEINIAVEGEHEEYRLHRAPIIDFNFGLLQNVQLTIETAYAISEHENDFDSFEFAVKWLFYQNDFFAIALYPKFKSYPIDSVFNEGENYELSIPMNFAISKSLDLVTDITYIYPREGEKHFEFGTYLKYKNDKHTYFIELFSEGFNDQNSFFILGNIGYTYQFHENIAFMISYGKELTNTQYRTTIGYSGLQFIF